MKKTGIKTAIIVVLAMTVMAGEAFAGPGGGGRGRGRGGRQGLGRGMAGGPQMDVNFQPAQPDNSWVPGPFCPFAQGPNQNIQGWQGPGPGGFGQGFQGPGMGGFGQGFQGRGMGGFGQGFQGRGMGGFGQGFGRRDMMMQRGPMAGRGGRGAAMLGRGGRGFQGRGMAMQGRGGRGFQGRGPAMQGRGGRDMAPQGWGMNNWQEQPGPGGIDRPGSGMQPQRFTPEDTDQTNQPMPPRGRGWAPGSGQGWRQGQAQGWGQSWGPNPQPQKAPDANAPEPPIVENQPDKPQGE